MGYIESDNPDYEITKEKIKNLAKEIATTTKKAIETKGKGKRKLILSESEDEEELLATAVDIIEDSIENKVSVKNSSKNFSKQEHDKVSQIRKKVHRPRRPKILST